MVWPAPSRPVLILERDQLFVAIGDRPLNQISQPPDVFDYGSEMGGWKHAQHLGVSRQSLFEALRVTKPHLPLTSRSLDRHPAGVDGSLGDFQRAETARSPLYLVRSHVFSVRNHIRDKPRLSHFKTIHGRLLEQNGSPELHARQSR